MERKTSKSSSFGLIAGIVVLAAVTYIAPAAEAQDGQGQENGVNRGPVLDTGPCLLQRTARLNGRDINLWWCPAAGGRPAGYHGQIAHAQPGDLVYFASLPQQLSAVPGNSTFANTQLPDRQFIDQAVVCGQVVSDKLVFCLPPP